MISTHATRKRAKLKRKQKPDTGSLVRIFPFHDWKPMPPLDQTMLHEWAKELARTSLHSYSDSVDLISTLWFKTDEQLLIDSVLYGKII